MTYVILVLAIVVVAIGAWLVVRAGRRRDGRPADGAAPSPPALSAGEAPAAPSAGPPRPVDRGALLADGGQLPWARLLDALVIDGGLRAASAPPVELGQQAMALGLRSRISAPAAAASEPHVLWGVRDRRQTFVRLGVDASRRLRQTTVVRVDLPRFTLVGESGVLRGDRGAVPPEVHALLAGLAPAPDVWEGLHVVGGAEGLVATRPQLDDRARGWIYDLWLCERIAVVTGAAPLAAERLSPSWKVPYGLGAAR